MKYLLAALLGVAVSGVTCNQSNANNLLFSFEKIVDTDTFIPGQTDEFTLLTIPSLDGDNVAFFGGGDGLYNGIFTYIDQQLAVVADTDTLVPLRTDEFVFFGNPSISGTNVAFHGDGVDEHEGIYTNIGGITPVADINTADPSNSNHEFSFFNNTPIIDGNNVAFQGFTALPEAETNIGAYLATNIGQVDQQLDTVADTSTPIPGGPGNFVSVGPSSLDGTDMALGGGDGSRNGVFTNIGGGLNKVVETGEMIPGATDEDFDEFVSFGPASLDDGHVVFRGNNGIGQQGIYTDAGDELSVIADVNTDIPQGAPDAKFTEFEILPSFDNGNTAFVGHGADNFHGIYLSFAGELTKVIDVDDTLDGKSPVTLRSGDEGLSGDKIVFLAVFGDGSQGIYTASFEETDILAGDYNENGTVDAADYTVWRDLLGQEVSLPNETETPGMVTQEDYVTWVANFGNSAGLGSSSLSQAAVPEPATLVLLLATVLPAPRFARRR